jgi:hypothetical protein
MDGGGRTASGTAVESNAWTPIKDIGGRATQEAKAEQLPRKPKPSGDRENVRNMFSRRSRRWQNQVYTPVNEIQAGIKRSVEDKVMVRLTGPAETGTDTVNG